MIDYSTEELLLIGLCKGLEKQGKNPDGAGVYISELTLAIRVAYEINSPEAIKAKLELMEIKGLIMGHDKGIQIGKKGLELYNIWKLIQKNKLVKQ